MGEIEKAHYNNPSVEAWKSTTLNLLNAIFGLPGGELHHNTHDVIYASSGMSLHFNMSAGEIQRDHVLRQQKRRAILEALVEQLSDLAPPAAATGSDEYRFHSEIERVSGQLYRDRHYKAAALEAFIRVIEEVKARSGLALDGDALMNQAFGCESRTPKLQFNALQTDAEKDEQKGLMFLYKGVVGSRNFKAHSNALFDDPRRAHEYLALASLLMRLLDIAQVNP